MKIELSSEDIEVLRESSSEDIEVLRESLELYLADLRREVAGLRIPTCGINCSDGKTRSKASCRGSVTRPRPDMKWAPLLTATSRRWRRGRSR
jgi:hypothetical protein